MILEFETKQTHQLMPYDVRVCDNMWTDGNWILFMTLEMKLLPTFCRWIKKTEYE